MDDHDRALLAALMIEVRRLRAEADRDRDELVGGGVPFAGRPHLRGGVGQAAVICAEGGLSRARAHADTVGMADHLSAAPPSVERLPLGVLVDDRAWGLTPTERRLLATVRTLPPTVHRALATRWAEQRVVSAHERSIFGTAIAL